MKPADLVLERTETVLGHRPTEVAAKRTLGSKTFQIDDKTFHVAKRLRPIHYRDDKGDWQEIDLTIPSSMKLDTAPYKLSLLTGKIGYHYTSRKNGGWMEIELVSLNGQPVKTPTRNRDGDKVRWSVAPGVSMYLQALPSHPEIFKVYDAPHTTVWKVTSSPDFPGQFNPNTRGRDANKDNLEIVSEFKDGLFTETWTGRVSRVPEGERKRRKKAWFTDPALPVLVDAAIQENIGGSADDIFEQTFHSTGTDIHMILGDYITSAELVINSNGTPNSRTRSIPGLRFQTVALPAGATVSSATLTVRVTQKGASAAATLKIYGNDVDDAPVWNNPANLPSGMPKTTAFALFLPTATGIKATDVTTVIAELAARAGWASGNDMALAIFPGTTNEPLIRIEDYGAPGTDEAQLDITYTVAAPAPSGVITLPRHGGLRNQANLLAGVLP